ncbi:hypothetical protein, partial [Loigolactobacillus coryniformis]|uniref:hypothetical protein n=1 Tax=Loigolactobacillus coryniformis TaxID=1610 RepID=UPI003991D620
MGDHFTVIAAFFLVSHDSIWTQYSCGSCTGLFSVALHRNLSTILKRLVPKMIVYGVGILF